MPNIYKGNINELCLIYGFKHNGQTHTVTWDFSLKKDALFYRGILGKIISFDYGTQIPYHDEALDYLDYIYENQPETYPFTPCQYFDYDSLEFHKKVSRKEFKQLKKIYKNSTSQNDIN